MTIQVLSLITILLTCTGLVYFVSRQTGVFTIQGAFWLFSGSFLLLGNAAIIAFNHRVDTLSIVLLCVGIFVQVIGTNRFITTAKAKKG